MEKNIIITFRVSEDLKTEMVKRCEDLKKNMSDYIRDLIKNDLNKEE